TAPSSGLCDSQDRTRSSRFSEKPEVPTTAWMPWSMHQCRLSITTSGVVKSTTTSAPASETLNSQSPSSTMATSSRSSAASTARHTSVPMRPRAPSTPTRIGSRSSVTSPNLADRTRVNPCGGPLTEHAGEVVVVERADDGQRQGIGQHLGGHFAHVVDGHGVDPGDEFVDSEQSGVEQLTLAEAAHPGAGVLQTEYQRTLEHALAPGHLGLGDALSG